jgi:ABC-type molybdenum transport system ATPase subunit/photorepair protein PhrA
LEFQNVTVMRGVKRALDSLTFSIAQGEHVAVVRSSGKYERAVEVMQSWEATL